MKNSSPQSQDRKEEMVPYPPRDNLLTILFNIPKTVLLPMPYFSQITVIRNALIYYFYLVLDRKNNSLALGLAHSLAITNVQKKDQNVNAHAHREFDL